MINKGMFTSATDLWSTPQWLFDQLDKEFNFVLDVCANDSNHKCDNYFTKEKDGFIEDWSYWKGWKWMNPPYGREIGKWIQKAYESKNVIALLPARTDTRWFHDYIDNKSNVKVDFIRGRLKFGDSKNSAPFPSMIVRFYEK